MNTKELDKELDRGWNWDEMRDKAVNGTLSEAEKRLIRKEAHRFDVAAKDLHQLLGKAQNQIHDINILLKLMGW